MSFIYNNRLVGCGAIMYTGQSTYPFFTSQVNINELPVADSIGNRTTYNFGDRDDYWTVMPGYKAIVYYDTYFSGTLSTYDNTYGTSVMCNTGATLDRASSLQLYYNNVLIPYPDYGYSETVNTSSGVSISMSNFRLVYNVAYNSKTYRLYEFYIGQTGTVTVNGGSIDLSALLIGGGGSGGAYTSGASEGTGGGGAGAFVTTNINVPTGNSFTVNVGTGGVSRPWNGTGQHGDVGLPTSIKNNTGATTLLNVGGGGSGAGTVSTAGSNKGTVTGTPGSGLYGSTGGATGFYATASAYQVSTAPFTRSNSTAIQFANTVAKAFVGGTGIGGYWGGGGGGGAGAAGQEGWGPSVNSASGGSGGAGAVWDVNGIQYAGGGGGGEKSGGNDYTYYTVGGAGGGGAPKISGATNTGSGGGAGTSGNNSGAGGSGICIIAVPI